MRLPLLTRLFSVQHDDFHDHPNFCYLSPLLQTGYMTDSQDRDSQPADLRALKSAKREYEAAIDTELFSLACSPVPIANIPS